MIPHAGPIATPATAALVMVNLPLWSLADAVGNADGAGVGKPRTGVVSVWKVVVKSSSGDGCNEVGPVVDAEFAEADRLVKTASEGNLNSPNRDLLSTSLK